MREFPRQRAQSEGFGRTESGAWGKVRPRGRGFCLLGFHLVWAAWVCALVFPVASFAAGLSREKVHAAYIDGDLDEARTMLESFRKRNPNMSTNDQVFMAKYLGVIYGARPNTWEKAREQFRLLLTLDRDAKIVDMYPSDEIFKLFREVEEETLAREKAASRKQAELQAGSHAGAQKGQVSQGPTLSAATPVNSGEGEKGGSGFSGNGGAGSSSGFFSKTYSKPLAWGAAGLGAVAVITWVYLANSEDEAKWTVVEGVSP